MSGEFSRDESDLRAIEEAIASGAESLSLAGSVIPPSISKLQSLRHLTLAGSSITDLSPIKNLKELESLDISSTNISDITPISELKSLKSLKIWASQVYDLKPLRKLINLETLDLAYQVRGDLSDLAALTSLRVLNIKSSGVLDLRPLRNIDLSSVPPHETVGIYQFDNHHAFDFDPELGSFELGTRSGVEALLTYLRGLDDEDYDRRLRLWKDFRSRPENIVNDHLPLAEEILQNDKTGRFLSVPKIIEKPDLLSATLNQLSDAIKDVLETPSNGLRSDSFEIRRLQRTIERYSNDPQRVEMDLTTIHGSLVEQISIGELPSSEENRALISALREGAQGIRATDAQVAENRRLLQEQALREAPPEALRELVTAEPVLSSITEGDLGVQIREDIQFLTRTIPTSAPSLPGVTRSSSLTIGRDEAVRIFGRSAGFLVAMRGNPEVIEKIEKNSTYRIARIMATLGGLVKIGLRLLGLD